DEIDTNDLFENALRAQTVTYPKGAVIFRDYGSTDSIDDRLSRLHRLRSSSSTGAILGEYTYNGVGRVTKVDYPQPDLRNNLLDSLDRFSQAATSHWVDYTSGTVT